MFSVFKTSICEELKKKIKNDDFLDIFLCLFNVSRSSSESETHPKSYANVSNTYVITTKVYSSSSIDII